MELQRGERYGLDGARDFLGARVDEQPDQTHVRRHPTGQLGRAREVHGARAGRIENETDGIDAERHGMIDVGRLRQTADLDSRTGLQGLLGFHERAHGIGNGHAAQLGSGTWKCSGYPTRARYRPSGMNVGAA